MPNEVDDVEHLKKRLADHHAKIDAAQPGSKEYMTLASVVLQDTRTLLQHEDQLVAQAQESKRMAAARVIRRTGVLTAGGLLVLGAVAGIGWVSRGWLLLIIPLLAAVTFVALSETGRPYQGQQQRTFTVWAFMAAAAATAVLSAEVVSAWWSIAVIALISVTSTAYLTAGMPAGPVTSDEA
ncbi:hypothetical protein F5972_07020 [Microbispora cellulosiformans]|uniref:Uncharacterized protein n=1 Tax=Microbispora cellulosiformans TaxID=2614688 RepID=A0A5J5KA00_9ACTN|nr:hypothetical protein [Microbispora cellulosiformans]KAA9380837.1 hypothetical protein F5972_07020 [Microbispora cellulosiformans]